ncbi:Mom family adenine methylcarbamoylation protein [Terrabacter sp. C0L_2]|uniref:Mom family adenine methylcarbamoylation protein n=1 Tax=Terrabacter sp. C0L_2 TaxID=3108389 RepID=UPI002ED27B50|nr:hypothetical protein U5C87_17565 [Terrabacter sp. C0L_2]
MPSVPGAAAQSLFEVQPAMQRLDPSRCSVAPVSFDSVRQVLAEAHYIGRPGATSVRLGLYVDGSLAGVITFGTIPSNNASAICGPEMAGAVLELTRLALYDWAPCNSESWFIGAAVHWLRVNRPDVRILLSYADGEQGHVGTIYQATNWLYTGTTTGDVLYQSHDGTVMHPRTTGRAKVLPPGFWIPSPTKHRYVLLLGTSKARRALLHRLRWEILPYPKKCIDKRMDRSA